MCWLWKYQSRAVTPQGLCSSSDWIMFGQILSPCRTMAQLLSVPQHMRVEACYTWRACLVTQWSMSGVSMKSWLFCNMPEWRENFFWSWMVNLFVLWSTKTAIFIWGCISVSNALIPPQLVNLSLQFCSPLLTEGVFSSGLPFQTWMLSGFLCYCDMKRIPISMTPLLWDFPEQNGSHRPNRREESNLVDYCLLVTPGALRR